MSTINVHELDVMAAASWQFRAEALPTWQAARGHRTEFDPFPGYGHDMSVVDDCVRHVLRCWEPSWDVDLYVANREDISRTNGCSSLVQDGQYEPCDCGEDGCKGRKWVKNPPRGFILLSGKRIPPIPPMTRYLVAHEYGHNVEWMLNAARGAEQPDDETLMADYAKMRGLEDKHLHHGGGGTWHDSATEVFACDFRIVVCGVLEDTWPHPGIAHPSRIPMLERWWADAQSELAAAAVAATAAAS